jgi:hypothetical protein
MSNRKLIISDIWKSEPAPFFIGHTNVDGWIFDVDKVPKKINSIRFEQTNKVTCSSHRGVAVDGLNWDLDSLPPITLKMT